MVAFLSFKSCRERPEMTNLVFWRSKRAEVRWNQVVYIRWSAFNMSSIVRKSAADYDMKVVEWFENQEYILYIYCALCFSNMFNDDAMLETLERP